MLVVTITPAVTITPVTITVTEPASSIARQGWDELGLAPEPLRPHRAARPVRFESGVVAVKGRE
jgi:hypothetical protein